MTYNIHHGRGRDGEVNLDRICDVIQQAAPDLVALQEVDRGLTRSAWIDQGQTIADALSMCHTAGHNWFLEEGAYGNAFLSRWPVTVIGNLDLSVTGRERRGCLLTRVHTEHGDLVVGSVHLGLFPGERRLQSETLLRRLEELCTDDPVILMGDFNTLPSSKIAGGFREAYRDVFQAVGRGPRATYRKWGLSLGLDYIYAGDGLLPLDAGVIRTPAAYLASDHFPLLARLQWAPTDVDQDTPDWAADETSPDLSVSLR